MRQNSILLASFGLAAILIASWLPPLASSVHAQTTGQQKVTADSLQALSASQALSPGGYNSSNTTDMFNSMLSTQISSTGVNLYLDSINTLYSYYDAGTAYSWAGANDISGVIVFSASGSSTTYYDDGYTYTVTGQVAFPFGTAYPTVPRAVTLTPENAAATALLNEGQVEGFCSDGYYLTIAWNDHNNAVNGAAFNYTITP